MFAHDSGDRLWGEACEMLERAERLHRQFFRPGLALPHSAGWEPPVDIFETEDRSGFSWRCPALCPSGSMLRSAPMS
jgi:hypothetical protein